MKQLFITKRSMLVLMLTSMLLCVAGTVLKINHAPAANPVLWLSIAAFLFSLGAITYLLLWKR